MDFYKYDALGNDYLVIDPNKCDLDMNTATVQYLCDRHHGLGSDGILYGPHLVENKLGLRIFNPDGGECEKSGNGLRIFSRYLLDAGYVKPSGCEIHLLMLNEDVEVQYLSDTENLIQINMGGYSLNAADIPVITDLPKILGDNIKIEEELLKVACVNIGNPHCVVFNRPVTKEVAENIGSLVCENSMFPEKINVQFVQVVDRHTIALEIWERGAGYTLASGSSSCASAIACYELGLVDRNITVNMPGGTVEIQIDSESKIHLTGAVKAVSTGYIANDLRQTLIGNE